jgi:hypothetical protein
MQNVPLDAVLHFDLHTANLGWLLTAAQPKLQHLEGWVAKSVARQLATAVLEGWVAKSVARQLATAVLWVRIQTSLKNLKRAT